MARKEIVDEQTAFDVSIICPNLITCTLSSTKSILISIKLQKAVVLYFTKKTKHLSTKQYGSSSFSDRYITGAVSYHPST
jgi:hypothetical protein